MYCKRRKSGVRFPDRKLKKIVCICVNALLVMHEDQGGVYEQLSTTNLRYWRLVLSSNLTALTLSDRFFTSLVYCMLPRALFEYWRKKTEKSKVFCWVIGLEGCSSVQGEQRKKPVAVGPLPGAYLLTETNFVPICGVTRKEFDTGQTHTHTHTHTHTPLKHR